LPVILYDFQIWSLILREEHRLRVFKSTVLSRIFGPRRDGVTGEWRKLYDEELHDLYCSSGIIRVITSRRIRWVEHVACLGKKIYSYRAFIGKPGGMRLLGRSVQKLEDNTKSGTLRNSI
jgi:hypothetical protein